MEIDASSLAARFIRNHGGRLFVWFEDFGRSPWAVQRVALQQPVDVPFKWHPADGFDVFLQADFTPPAELRIRRRPRPMGPIEVLGTGAGDADLGGGGGGDGGWPGGHGGGDGGGGHGGHGGH